MKTAIPMILTLAMTLTSEECPSGNEDDTPLPDDETPTPADATPPPDSEPPSDPPADTQPPDEATRITFSNSAITVDGSGASVSDSVVTISSAGSFLLSGNRSSGQVVVDTDDDGEVVLYLDGLSLGCSSSAPLFISQASGASVVLVEGTTNHLADATSYTFPSADEDEPNATLFSKADLTLSGSGSLEIVGNYNDGLTSKDGLTILSGTLSITAVDDGIRGKDFVLISGGSLNIQAGGDGIKSDNDSDTTLGYITFIEGDISVTSGGDAIAAETSVAVGGGTFSLTAGGGATGTLNSEVSTKGIKGLSSVVLEGGDFTINTSDDAVHSNGAITMTGGVFTIATGDDAFHADASLDIDGGTMTVTRSYEGLESALITINDGYLDITSSDDGINVAGGNDGSGSTQPPPPGGGQPPVDDFASGDYLLSITGGFLAVYAGGDGLDSNGSIEMSGGQVLVHGPTANDNGALDYAEESGGTFTITGGLLVAAGSSGMAAAPGTSSTQASVLVAFRSTNQANTLFHLKSSSGTALVTFQPSKTWQSVVYSSPSLKIGTSYDIYYGGTTTGTSQEGLYSTGTYTPGTRFATFTPSSVTTTVR